MSPEVEAVLEAVCERVTHSPSEWAAFKANLDNILKDMPDEKEIRQTCER